MIREDAYALGNIIHQEVITFYESQFNEIFKKCNIYPKYRSFRGNNNIRSKLINPIYNDHEAQIKALQTKSFDGEKMISREEALENVKKFNSTVKNETEEIIAKEVEQSFNMANLFIEDASKNGKTDTMMCFSYKTCVDSFDIAINEQEKIVDKIAGNVSSKLRQNGYETTVLNNRALRSITLSIMWGVIR